MVILGCDVSLEHCGFCFLNEDGKLLNYLYFTNNKKEWLADVSHSIFLGLKREKDENLECYRVKRLSKITEKFQTILDEIYKETRVYFVVEDYAYGAQSTALCQIAEFTGIVKNKMYDFGGYIRLYDPISTKFFSTGKGNATKTEMLAKAKENEDFICNAPFKVVHKKEKPDDIDGPLTDVVDSYFLAKLVWTELKLRSGEIELKNLPEYQVLTFNRVTKSYPINILARDFIHKND